MYGIETGLLAFSFAFTFQANSSLLNTFIVKGFATSDDGKDGKPLNFKTINFIYGGMSIIALIVLIFVYKGNKTKN